MIHFGLEGSHVRFSERRRCCSQAGHLGYIRTVIEAGAAYRRHVLANHYRSQCRAVAERHRTDGRHRIGNHHFLQAHTEPESIVADGRHRIGDINMCQRRAVMECIILDPGHCIGDCHLGQRPAILECAVADSGDRIGHAVVSHLFGDVHHAAVGVVVGGGIGHLDLTGACDVIVDAVHLKTVGHHCHVGEVLPVHRRLVERPARLGHPKQNAGVVALVKGAARDFRRREGMADYLVQCRAIMEHHVTNESDILADGHLLQVSTAIEYAIT